MGPYHRLHIRLVLQDLSCLITRGQSKSLGMTPPPGLSKSANVNTLSQSLCTSCSASCLHVIKLSIHPSRIGIDAGSVVGDSLVGDGTLPTSSMFVSIV